MLLPIRNRQVSHARADASGRRWPFNVAAEWGAYFRADVRAGNVWVRRTQGLPPFELERKVTSTGTDFAPRLALDLTGRLWLLFVRGSGPFDVYRAFSDDDADTWSDPTMAFPGGKWCETVVHPDLGIRIEMAWLASGQLSARRWFPGDNAPESFALTDGTDPLLAKDDQFRLAWLPDGSDRLVLSVALAGEDDVSEWWSADNGETWTRVA